jgi:hypothetical protein
MTIVIKILIGLVGYGVWAFMAWFDPSLRPDFLKFNVAMAVGTIGLVLRDMQTPPAPGQVISGTLSTISAAGPADKGQGGFASIRLLTMMAAIALGLSLLAGCTTTTASIYSGLYTQAKTGVQVFDDNTLSTMKDLVCAQPYSAIQRHPELQPGIVALCGPMSNTASLDPAQVMQMLSIAKQLGLVPASAAAAPASAAK